MPAPAALEQQIAKRLVAKEASAVAGEIPVILKSGFGPFSLVGGFASSISSVVGFATMGAGILRMLGGIKWLGKAAKPLNKAADITGLVDQPLAGLSKAASEVLGKNAVTGAISNIHGGVGEYAKRILGPKLAGNLAQNSLSTTLFSGTMVVSEAANTALGFGARLRALKQMQFDLTGKMPSSFAVLTGGGLHPLVREARKELTGLKATLGTGLQVGGTVANAAMMLSGSNRSTGWKSILLSMGVGMGTSMAASVVTAGNTALTAYSNLHMHFAQAGRAPESAYAALIGGLAKNANDQMVSMFAKQCADKQLQPAMVLKMVEQTSFFKKAGISAAQEKPKGGLFKTVLSVGLCVAGVGAAVAYNRGTGDTWVQRIRSGIPRNLGDLGMAR